jgi:lipopolysaccharide export LptBFGC system permease protein LptF
MKRQEKKFPFPFIFLAVYLVAIIAIFIVGFKVLGIPIAAVGFLSPATFFAFGAFLYRRRKNAKLPAI